MYKNPRGNRTGTTKVGSNTQSLQSQDKKKQEP